MRIMALVCSRASGTVRGRSVTIVTIFPKIAAIVSDKSLTNPRALIGHANNLLTSDRGILAVSCRIGLLPVLAWQWPVCMQIATIHVLLPLHAQPQPRQSTQQTLWSLQQVLRPLFRDVHLPAHAEDGRSLAIALGELSPGNFAWTEP
jgi:hypothetical protein